MSEPQIIIETETKANRYEIAVRHDGLRNCGEWARECLGTAARKIALISNAKIYGIYGEQATKTLEAAGFEVHTFLMKDGERHKSLKTLEKVLAFFSENNLTRADAAVALGGGVVGDLTGFAASIFMRGIAFLQIPTTLLAMVDSSVGGKTAVNTSFGKNLVGTFYQPKGVLIDISVLETLAKRELTAGFCECIKQGAIAGRKLLDSTSSFLSDYPGNASKVFFEQETFISDLEALVRAQVEFKAAIVRGDELENIARVDGKSRKILNFGHTLGHALEKATKYRYFKHGEAVGYGILYAAELSKTLEILGKDDVNLLYDVVHRVGRLPDVTNIDAKAVFEAIKFDKKSTGKTIQWILLKGIGEPTILSDEEITQSEKSEAFDKILQRY